MPTLDTKSYELEARAFISNPGQDDVSLRHLPNATPSFHVEFSEEPAEAIVKLATDLGVDAIAMATHGRTGIRHALVGSVAEQVMLVSGAGHPYRPSGS